MPDEDVAAIVVYLRSLSAGAQPAAEDAAAVPAVARRAGRAQAARRARSPAPDLSTPERRGEYLLRTSACHHCHTPMTPRAARRGARHGGRQPVRDARRPVPPTNLTPDATGIAHYDEATFVR